ncbi:hypothetical protein OG245_15115 [Streptomyces sp. NBC_01116]|uniref:hypothetical protein n=1 Tax=Streptomyces sp. NBC_01116 TaxID=2903752 RepID=UPI0032461EFE
MTFAPRLWVVGEVVSAAIMNQEVRDQWNSVLDAWTSYTPTWTSSGTNPALGNGTITGRYMKVGRTCTVSFLLTTGSTTTYGTGTYLIGLPFPAAATVVSYLGSARLSGTDTWIGHMLLGSGSSSANVTFSASATNTRGANMSGTVPETLAAGVQLRATITYQTAT